jgi:hypothetical protein
MYKNDKVWELIENSFFTFDKYSYFSYTLPLPPIHAPSVEYNSQTGFSKVPLDIISQIKTSGVSESPAILTLPVCSGTRAVSSSSRPGNFKLGILGVNTKKERVLFLNNSQRYRTGTQFLVIPGRICKGGGCGTESISSYLIRSHFVGNRVGLAGLDMLAKFS